MILSNLVVCTRLRDKAELYNLPFTSTRIEQYKLNNWCSSSPCLVDHNCVHRSQEVVFHLECQSIFGIPSINMLLLCMFNVNYHFVDKASSNICILSFLGIGVALGHDECSGYFFNKSMRTILLQ
jgi:hypothetical protein